MEFFKPGRYFDIWRQHKYWLVVSTLINLTAIIMMVWRPGLNFGTDFKGGTEIEIAFKQPLDAGALRATVVKLGFATPDVVQIRDDRNPSRFMIRVQEVSALDEAQRGGLKESLCYTDLPADERCPVGSHPTEMKFSPGGDKITLRYDREPDLEFIAAKAAAVSGVHLRATGHNPQIVSERDHKVEVLLKSKGDQLIDGLRRTLGPQVVPDAPLRVEWVGPKAGKQLRDAAFKSVGVSMIFIMAYIAFRFDMRFAPGAVISMIHDVFVVLCLFSLSRKEFSLSTVAALLTIVGYSVNDTVIIYDRIRENLGKHRGKTFPDIINRSVSETLSRTILTTLTVQITLLAFLVWGTGTIHDFAFALFIGFITGTYSSVFIAAPTTEYIDRHFFSGSKARPKGPPKKAGAVV